MEWTKDKPTEQGWYFTYRLVGGICGSWVAITCVWKTWDGEVVYDLQDDSWPMDKAPDDVYWAGPIDLPEPPKE